MSIQFSHQFHSHWLHAPATTRRKIKDDLSAIIDLLKPETSLTQWQKQHGIYHTDTSKAEQASLFADELETSTQTAPRTNNHDSGYGFAKSSFLKNVTAGMSTETPSSSKKTTSVKESEIPEISIPEQQVSTITKDPQLVNSDLNSQIKQVTATNLKTALNPKVLAEHIAKNQSDQTASFDIESYLHNLESKVDDYLAFALQNIKSDVMAWVKEELTAQAKK